MHFCNNTTNNNIPQEGWACEGQESGTPFTDLSLGDEDWCDYDEDGSCPVGIAELEYKVH